MPSSDTLCAPPSTHHVLRVAIAGGGTGGHLFPGIALAEAIQMRRPQAEITFLGAVGGIEQEVLQDGPFPLVLLPPVKLHGRGIRRLLGAPGLVARLVRAVGRARAILSARGIRLVVGTGGYASAAPLLAARTLGLPTILLEQNAIPGRTNRLLARWATETHVQFRESVRYFTDPSRVHVSGNPVRSGVLAAAGERLRDRGVPPPPLSLLILGGSQGARAINRAVMKSLPGLAARIPALRIVHLTGRADLASCRSALACSGLSGRAIAFQEDIGPLYREADLVVCRAGATTIAELTALKLPSVLIPYPFAADNHQQANAKILAAAGAARLVSESALEVRLVDTVAGLLTDRGRLADMAAAAGELAWPNAAQRLAARIESLSRPPDGKTDHVSEEARAA